MATVKQQENIILGTKKHIIKVARSLFSEYSYLGVSMSDIAKKLNITKTALYYHFTGKAEIYKKVLDDVFDGLNLVITEALQEKTSENKMSMFVRNYLDFGFKEKNIIKSLMLKLPPDNQQINKYTRKIREKTIDLVQPLIKEMFINKNKTKKIDSRFVASLLIGMMDGLLLEYSLLNKKIDSVKVSNQIIATLF